MYRKKVMMLKNSFCFQKAGKKQFQLWRWVTLVWIGLFASWTHIAHAAPTLVLSPVTIGELNKLSLFAQLEVVDADVNTTGKIFVVAISLDKKAFSLNKNGWHAIDSGNIPAYFEGSLNTHSVQIFSGLDASALAGTEVYVGYGTSSSDMLNRQLFDRAYTVPSEVPFRRIEASWVDNSGMPVANFLFKNEYELDRYWRHFIRVTFEKDGTPVWSKNDWPQVDWTKEMIVGMTRGTGGSPCTANYVRITKILNDGKHIQVYFDLSMSTIPDFGVCSQVVTPATDFVIIPRSNLPVKFIENK